MEQTTHAVLKKSGNSIIVVNGDDFVTLDISNLASAQKALDVTVRAFNDISKANHQLRQSVQHDGDTIERYPTTAIQPSLNDLTKGLNTTCVKHVQSAVEHTPNLLQGQVAKQSLSAIASCYEEIGQMLLAAEGMDVVSIAKSLLAKSVGIKRDLDLLNDTLDAPLVRAKAVKQQMRIENDIRTKAIQTGKDLAGVEFAGIDDATLAIARRIAKAKAVSAQRAATKSEAIANALKASK
jgi:hypothetical protein